MLLTFLDYFITSSGIMPVGLESGRESPAFSSRVGVRATKDLRFSGILFLFMITVNVMESFKLFYTQCFTPVK